MHSSVGAQYGVGDAQALQPPTEVAVVADVSVLVGLVVEVGVVVVVVSVPVLAPAVTVAGPSVVGSPLVPPVVEVSWLPGLKQAPCNRNDPT